MSPEHHRLKFLSGCFCPPFPLLNKMDASETHSNQAPMSTMSSTVSTASLVHSGNSHVHEDKVHLADDHHSSSSHLPTVDRYGEPLSLSHANVLSIDASEAAAARGKAFVQVISCVLSRLIISNDSEVGPDGRPANTSGIITKFHALRPPSIGIRDYLERINKYANCSPECLVLMLIYIDRLIQKNSLVLSSLNVHRIVITAVMIAAKFFDDQYFNNAYYAKVGGMPCAEVNSLELEFLFSIKFSLHVSTEVYGKYFEVLANHMLCSAATTDNRGGVGGGGGGGGGCECPKCVAGLRFGVSEVKYTGLQDYVAMLRTISTQFAGKSADGSGRMVDSGPIPNETTGVLDEEMSTSSSSSTSAASV